jgi:NADH:ubiquinone oxidoreductase subunit E
MSAREEILLGLAGEPPRVPRFEHGSRVPGWDESVDLEKDPAEVPDPDSVEVPAALRAEIEARMADYPDRHSAALPALAAAQRVHGWCSPQALDQVACVMQVTPAYLESVSSFYDMLETHPVPGHSVYVCTNISCSLRGADALYEAVAREAGDEFNVRSFECLGACDIAPMASVDGVYIGPLSPEDVPALLDDLRAGREVMPERHLVRRATADPRANSRDWGGNGGD